MNETNNEEQIENNRFYEKIKVLTEQYKNNSGDKDDTWKEIGKATDDYINHISQNRDIFSTALSSIIQKRYKTVIEQKQQDHKDLTDKISDKISKRECGSIFSLPIGVSAITCGLLATSLPVSGMCCLGTGAVLSAGSACALAGCKLASQAAAMREHFFDEKLVSIKTDIDKLQQDITETGDKPHEEKGQNGKTNFHNRYHIVDKLNDLRKRCNELYNILDKLAGDYSIEMTKDDVVELLEHLFEVHSVEEQLNKFKNNNIASTNLNNGVNIKNSNNINNINK